jgi:hypothetical protein
MRDGAQQEVIDCVARNNIIAHTGAAGLGTYSGERIRFFNNALLDVARDGQAPLWVVMNTAKTPSRDVWFIGNWIISSTRAGLPMVVTHASDPPICAANLYFDPEVHVR